MELIKPKDNLSFKIDDVTFFVRSTATVADKLALDLLGDYKDGTFVVERYVIFEKVVQLFVNGWDGVTEDGKPVPYSFHTLMTRLPYDVSNDRILRLATFIIDELKLFPSPGDERKNG